MDSTQQTAIDVILNRVRAFVAQPGWSVLRLATEAGINEASLRPLRRSRWNPTASTLRAVLSVVERHEDSP